MLIRENGTEGGVGWGEEKGKQYKYRFLHIDTQAVITVYVPATTVSGGEMERDRGLN